MRINLTLQCIQFTFSPFILLTDNFLHKRLNPFIWSLNGITQMSYFWRASYVNIRFSSCFICFNRFIQFPDRFGYFSGNQPVSFQKHHHKNHDRCKNIISEIVNSCSLHALRYNSDQFPSCIGNVANHYTFLVSICCNLISALLIPGSLQTILFKQSPGHLCFSRMIDHLSVTADHIIIDSFRRIINLL